MAGPEELLDVNITSVTKNKEILHKIIKIGIKETMRKLIEESVGGLNTIATKKLTRLAGLAMLLKKKKPFNHARLIAILDVITGQWKAC